ncbi:hypothetical protein NLI96_g10853 [Meripilus lineatus]|uniref:Uncharacterized protein n=1 Tax=Meripilus lineatus TaxID=2056292 RepID=A0AAD5YBJ5_9APHY|nr:hypothetical protein NLI96_g10853 [Physisporinus lineatus]
MSQQLDVLPETLSEGPESERLSYPFLDVFPTEIWAMIFEQACTDDGTTGRSLSLVSRYVSQVSRPMKYNSIVLQGHKKIKRFLKHLLAHSNDDVPKVRHLLINQRKVKPRPPSTFPVKDLDEKIVYDAVRKFDIGRRSILKMLFEVFHEQTTAGFDQYQSYLKKLDKGVRGGPKYDLPQRIISILSPHLITLTCTSKQFRQTPGHLTLSLNRLHFPLLTELTLHGTCGHDLPYDVEQPPLEPTENPTFPSLRYFHCADTGLRNISQLIPYRAPALTHLRLTGKLGNHLEFLFRKLSEHAPPSCDPHPVPKLRNIGILAQPVPDLLYPEHSPDYWLESVTSDVKEMLQILKSPRHIQLEQGADFNPFLDDDDPMYSIMDANRDWMRRVEGGGPYW